MATKKIKTKSRKKPSSKKIVSGNKALKSKIKKAFKAIYEILGGLTVLALVVASVTSSKAIAINDATLLEPPLAPTRLMTKVKNSTVTITWQDKSKNKADEYAVYRYDEALGEYVEAPKNQILSVFSKKYISKENDSGKTYLYKIMGIKNYYAPGETVATKIKSPLSYPVSIEIPYVKAPNTPSGFRAKVKNSLITFSWEGDADWYKLERYDNSLKNYFLESPDVGIPVKNFSNRKYEPGKTYKFRLSAYNNIYSLGVIKNSLRSLKYTTITIKIPNVKAPSAPTGLSYDVKNNNIVKLRWANPSRYRYWGRVATDINGVDGYKIVYYNDISKEWLPLDPKNHRFVSDQAVNISELVSGQTVQYKVMGYKKIYNESTLEFENLDGPYSKPISVTVP